MGTVCHTRKYTNETRVQNQETMDNAEHLYVFRSRFLLAFFSFFALFLGMLWVLWHNFSRIRFAVRITIFWRHLHHASLIMQPTSTSSAWLQQHIIITSCAGGRHNMPPPPASWPLTIWLGKWCPSHLWCGLPLYISQCSTLVRNTVVRAILQVYEKWLISTPWGAETAEPIEMELAWVITSVTPPHMHKTKSVWKGGSFGGGGEMFNPSVLFLLFFGFLNGPPAYSSLRIGWALSAPKNVFWW